MLQQKAAIVFSFLCVGILTACTLQQKTVVQPNQKQEVSAIYKECLQQEHGVMLNCIQQRVKQLGEDIEVFDHSIEIKRSSDWQAPPEYAERTGNVPESEASLKRGEEIFQFYCVACHSDGGTAHHQEAYANVAVSDLTTPKLRRQTDGALFWKITEGSWPMPAFWEGDILTEEDIWMLIQYVRSLSYEE